MTQFTLADLGWSAHFLRQIDEGERPARVNAIHRDRIEALSPDGPLSLTTPEQTGSYAVGDWVTYDSGQVQRRLDRISTIGRRAAGEVAKEQLIAANVDTLGIVTSCNADFNTARLERYLALCTAGLAIPLIILTKADLADDPTDYCRQAEALSPLVTAIALNGTDPAQVAELERWCGPGQTLALVGSSGVGKTTIQNILTGVEDATQSIRQADAKGRHTTTARALRRTTAGGWLIDTPGMRELRLSDAAEGIETVFSDVAELATECKFSDCAHDREPGCAIQTAIAAGTLDRDRFARWQKLEREDRYNTETVHEAHARFRKLGKMYAHGKARSAAKRGER